MGRHLEQDWEGILSMERCVKKETWAGQKEKSYTSHTDYTEQSKRKLSKSVGSEVAERGNGKKILSDLGSLKMCPAVSGCDDIIMSSV